MWSWQTIESIESCSDRKYHQNWELQSRRALKLNNTWLYLYPPKRFKGEKDSFQWNWRGIQRSISLCFVYFFYFIYFLHANKKHSLISYFWFTFWNSTKMKKIHNHFLEHAFSSLTFFSLYNFINWRIFPHNFLVHSHVNQFI